MLDKSRCVANDRYSYDVDEGISFEAGQIAKLVEDVNGNPIVQICDSGELPHGTFWKDKATGMTKTIQEESVTFDTNAKNLNNTNLVSNSVKVTNSAGTVTYTENTDYTINYTNGTITRLAGGGIAANATVLVTYRYNVLAKDLFQEGQGQNFINDYTLGTGKIAVVEDFAILYTLVYDSQATFNIGDALRVMNGGLLTTNAYETGPRIGKVIKPPCAGDPYLGWEQRTVIPGD